MKRPAWFEQGAPPTGLGLPLAVLSRIYAGAARLHRGLYERGRWPRQQLGCKVISVGNLVVGGAGKTPTAAWVAAQLRARGHRVVLASRGYGGANRDPVQVVSDGRYVRATAETAGDEAMLLAALAPGVPVLVGRRRDLVGQRAVAAFDAHILVLDDGFQHYRVARDLDLVTVHGAAGFGNRCVVPRGPLRESPAALGRADAIGVVDGPLSEADEGWLGEYAPEAHRFVVERTVRGTRPLAGGAEQPIEALEGRPLGLLSGLARPASFRETMEASGLRIVAERSFPDHHRYRKADLAGLEAEAPLWLTTEKDAGKLLPRWARSVELRIVVLQTEVEEGAALLDWIEDRLRAKASGRRHLVPAASAAPRGAKDHPGRA